MLNGKYVDLLNSRCKFKRVYALKKIAKQTEDLNKNNDTTSIQIHTNCSFSPYSPSLAAYMAKKSGLRVAGIMDNYTLSGAREFIKACRILQMTYTVGVEIRASFKNECMPTANVSVMGIALRNFERMENALKSYRDRQEGNINATCEAVNKRFKRFGIQLDFKKDVAIYFKHKKEKVYLSKYVYLALSKKLYAKFSETEIAEILNAVGIKASASRLSLISSKEENSYYVYDLTNILFDYRDLFYCRKSYSDADSIVKTAHSIGAVCAFQYYAKENETFAVGTAGRIFSIIDEVKRLGFDGFCFDPDKMDDDLRSAVFNKLAEYELLPFNLLSVEFPRQEFEYAYSSKSAEEIMERSVYTVVGSEICENQTGEGFVTSTLKSNGFEDKITLFSKIGRGE